MGIFNKNSILEESKVERKKLKEQFKKEFKLFTTRPINYLGGFTEFPDIFREHCLEVNVYSGGLLIEAGPTLSTDYKFYSYFMPIKDYDDASIRDDIQIQKDVTFTRLLALGIFAFAAKKKTVTGTQYLTINYKNKDGELSQALFSDDAKNMFTLTSIEHALNKAKKQYLNNK